MAQDFAVTAGQHCIMKFTLLGPKPHKIYCSADKGMKEVAQELISTGLTADQACLVLLCHMAAL